MTKCPKCHTDDATVIETRPHKEGVRTRRRRWCVNPACCIRWTTYEKEGADPAYAVVPRTGANLKIALAIIRAQQERAKPLNFDTSNGVNGHHRQRVPDPTNGVDRPHELGQATQGLDAISSVKTPAIVSGGVGGGLPSGSVPALSLSLSDQDPDPSKKTSQKVDRARAKLPKATEYPQRFLDFWDRISSPSPKGPKSDALKSWLVQGEPDADLLVRKWNEYLGSIGDYHAMHVRRWLGARGWEEIYEQPTARRPTSRVERRATENQQMFDGGREWAAEGTK